MYINPIITKYNFGLIFQLSFLVDHLHNLLNILVASAHDQPTIQTIH